MCQQCTEHFVEPQRLGTVVELQSKLLALTVELEEHLRLVLQNMRFDRLIDEVDCTRLVALEHPVLFACAGSYEDQRDVPRPLTAAKQFGQLETVHFRHLHIEES